MTSSKFEINDDILDFLIKKANGIKGLVDRSLEIIPNQCIQPKEHRLNKSQIDNQESIPTIDLSTFYDLNVEKSIQEAAAKWGCFQIINHGIPIGVLEDLKDAAHKFFELPAEEKIMSNDRYKSIEHCVAVDLGKARISVPLFVNSSLDSFIGPFPQMLKDGEKPVYKHVLHSDYWDYFYRKRPSGKESLDFFKI
ncbi:feruloyl CoA ortho-hydroxylase 1-like [Solanum tuberosum]|uniref:feruloyl CoA ortho-hydroxylase 1-like n=1 Tax=Solanum tuberosum TaxID=4113 RepID=UPI00073A0F85|nr:PREDICTED: feruloyl CoA ortho-hydroxylase 1-like [Solanum tuberosum]